MTNKITYKGTYEGGKEVWCNGAKTKLCIAKTCYGMYEIYFDDTVLATVAYTDDARNKVEKLLEVGIGRNYKDEK